MNTAENHVNEVAVRLRCKAVASNAHHCTVLPYAGNLKFQIVVTRNKGNGEIEAVWTFDQPKDRVGMNKRRGDACEKMLEVAGAPHKVYRRDSANDVRVGVSFALPDVPDSVFYDLVAERAKWVQNHVRPSELDRVK